jgi:hypothetical protein
MFMIDVSKIIFPIKCMNKMFTDTNTPKQLMKLLVRTSSLNLSIDVKSRGMK